jgi:cardiolipin synthase
MSIKTFIFVFYTYCCVMLSISLGLSWSILYYVFYLIFIIGTIIVIVLDNRNPVHTIAWILVLLFLPFVGLVLYFFFGRNFFREHLITKKSFNELLRKPEAEYLAQPAATPEYIEYRSLVNFYKLTERAYPFDGNRTEIYTDGYSMLKSLIRELMNAKQYIHIEYYIIDDDPVGRLIRDVLIDKARAGVEVRLIYDDVGCWKVPHRFFETMLEAGIEVRSFLRVRFPLFTSRVNYRNHRKVVVIDGQKGFVGGMNLAVRYLRGEKNDGWRDTHILVEGKAVHGLQTSFLLDWYFVDRSLLTDSKYFTPIGIVGSSTIQIVSSSPVGRWREILLGLTKAILGAKKYFYIQTPYFLPTDTLLSAMQTAALSGVDVRLMLPAHGDNWLTQLAGFSYLRFVLEAGVKVYFYQEGFLHSKLMVSDDLLTTVGSTNVDFRSFQHNFEINAFIYDKDTALESRNIFMNDQHHSVQITLNAWMKRSNFHHAAESLARLVSPLL